jgi:flagellar hook-associated protein 3 FlgL
MMKSLSTIGLYQERNASLRRLEHDLAVTGREIGSLRKSDVAKSAGRDLGTLFALRARVVANEQSYRTLDTFDRRASAMSQSLVSVEKGLGTLLTSAAMNAPSAGSTLGSVRVAAESAIAGLVDALNVSVDGRFLFSGAETAMRSLLRGDEVNPGSGLSPNQVMAGILDGSAFVPAQPPAFATFTAADAATAIARIDAVFDGTNAGAAPPLDAFSFERTIYSGEVGGGGATVRFGDGPATAYGQPADAPGFRNALQGAYMLASVDLVQMAGTPAYEPYVTAALDKLAQGLDGIRQYTAEIGAVQNEALVRRSDLDAELVLLNTQINGFEQADPVEAQTRFVEIEKQIEASYSVTVRASRLRLTNFL